MAKDYVKPAKSSVSPSVINQLNQNDTHQNNIFNFLNIRLWNARSIRYKTTTVSDCMISDIVEIMFLTETCLNESDYVVIGECTLPTHTFVSIPRGMGDEHGGIAMLLQSSLKLRMVPFQLNVTTFEYASALDPASGIQYVIIYSPPSSTENGFLTSSFLNEFEEFMAEITLLPTKVVLLGDFNVYVDIPSKWDAK